jgi:predicted ABC-type ATPase
MSKNLYIISGCNGAGKTTASYTVLPEVLGCREFVNADEIARGLSTEIIIETTYNKIAQYVK